jgi:hypothetical protein
MLGGGGAAGGGLGLDLSAVIQAALVGLVLFSAAVVAVRRAASRYFVVDAAGFAASYDDHHHSSAPYTMPSQGNQQEQGPCAECGGVSSKKCSGCKRVRYWCVPFHPISLLPNIVWRTACDLAEFQRNLSLMSCDLVVRAVNSAGILHGSRRGRDVLCSFTAYRILIFTATAYFVGNWCLE